MSNTQLEQAAQGEDSNEKDDRLYEEFCEFIEEFKGESDRACVILGASKLDQILGLILERFLLPCPNSQDQIFTNNGPLGTFSAKIDMTYRLGLIDSEACRAIHMVRKIRNTFAHEVYGASLASGSHKDRIKALVLPAKEDHHFKWLRDNFFSGVPASRANFSTMLGLLVARLEGLADKLEPVSTAQIQHLLPQSHNKQMQPAQKTRG